jgi:outer membrane lipoprotein-sorting protein
VNKFLRTAPPSRLLGLIIGLVAAAAIGTTIAIAAQGIGPVPPRESLAKAIHQVLGARAPEGVFADIKFTDNLISSDEIQGSDPLLNGGTGRLWITGHRLRLEIQGDNGDAQIVVNGRSFWAYDPAFKTVYRATLPAFTGRSTSRRRTAKFAHEALPSVARIQAGLNRLARHLSLSGALPTDVGGQAAYSVRVSPQHDNGLLGAAQLGWDALRGVPLQVGLYARGNPSPVLALSASDISFGPQSASVFDIKPPSQTHVVWLGGHGGTAASEHSGSRSRLEHQASVTGVKAVGRHLQFTLDAPTQLAGRSRGTVRLLGFTGHPAALLLYGHGLGTVVVLEQPASHTRTSLPSQSGEGPGLSLPTLSVRGVSAQELQTAIGTLVRFTRGHVTYTVLGSVTAGTAAAAARGL